MCLAHLARPFERMVEHRADRADHYADDDRKRTPSRKNQCIFCLFNPILPIHAYTPSFPFQAVSKSAYSV